MLRASTFLIAIAFTVGCTTASFEPYSAAQQFDPVVAKAIRIYEGDVETLAQAGSEIVGYVNVAGGGYTSWNQCAARASSEAAKQGGTHFLLLESDVSYGSFRTPGSSSTTTTGSASAYGYGNYAYASGSSQSNTTYYPPQTITVAKPHTRYAVLRVSKSCWSRLPEAMRPKEDLQSR